jgi:hypothetical protein
MSTTSGASLRGFGTVLKWLSERTSSVYSHMTAKHMSRLPSSPLEEENAGGAHDGHPKHYLVMKEAMEAMLKPGFVSEVRPSRE